MSVISNLVERTVRSTSIRSPSALFATERGRDARTYAGETSAHPGGAWASETRAPGCHLCGRDARAPRRRLGGRDPRTRLSLMRARRPRTQAALGRARPAHLVVTYAGETPALPGGAWAGATRGGRCVNDLRAAFQDAPGRCAREPMTARCRTWGARHAVPLLIRHRNDDMWRSGRNAPSCSPHSRGFGEDLSLSESLPSESMLARLPDSHCDRIACLYPGTGYDEH